MTNFLHDAEHRTESWKRRHSPDAIAQLGVWRWKGIMDNAGRILDLIVGKRVIDFGGADGPLGFGSIVVDEKAERKTLNDVDGQVDVIFTSHTLEHLEQPEVWLKEAAAKLTDGGHLIIHVPAFTCKRWQKEVYNNPNQPNGHKHTFSLWPSCTTDATTQLGGVVADAMSLESVNDLYEADYVGDNSILIIARKP